jgi:hypothetical protein
MKTSNKKGENILKISNKNTNLNVTPFTPRKQINFSSYKAKKYDISCSQREKDRENLKNNLLLTYLECQNCPNQSQNQVLKISSDKKKPPMLLSKFQNQYSKKFSNELIVSLNI